jgi:hypothetical protein
MLQYALQLTTYISKAGEIRILIFILEGQLIILHKNRCTLYHMYDYLGQISKQCKPYLINGEQGRFYHFSDFDRGSPIHTQIESIPCGLSKY